MFLSVYRQAGSGKFPELLQNPVMAASLPAKVSRALIKRKGRQRQTPKIRSSRSSTKGADSMNLPSLTRRHFVASLVLAPLAAALTLPAGAESSPSVEVWKDPTCGCCKEWIAHLRNAGFTVTAHDSGNAVARAKAGIAPQYGSCHTALVDGYAIEGHVPARDIQRLLKERPNAIGLAVPGMVKGSPGMEDGGIVQPYNVLLLHRDGGSSIYAKYRA